ncbi:carbohydrate ABC transporter permease [Cellulomonas gilvus]|uniref:Binding-protein-dependent transport systems inner membrane component n=1 Tax=Cellulomonas gilvus (strain ATCC 13127 / NRRL B-14078) TaxID=593907 RepID=F8A0V0_CELGA|nr:carbohydrate ABC transporter permease [Cellulomonas gilvus]AEI11572.1 binding-protein-dependent transport systems inner membrane component [Cellulomonas gilvus ATCC 13127]
MSSIPVIQQSAGKGAARAAARKTNRKVGGYDRRPPYFMYILLGIVLLVGVAPIYYTLVVGSSDPESIAKSPLPQLFPDASLFDKFDQVINAEAFSFWQAVWNSLLIAVVVSASTVLFSTLAGFAFAKLRFPGRKGLLVFVIATMAVPTQLGVVPLYIIMTKLEWVGHLQAVIIPSLVGAFGVFWMTQYLEEALPYELVEAARVDGASMFRTFWSIALPAARPAAAMLALFTFVAQWVNFFWPSIVLNSQNPTLPLAVKLLQQNYFVDYSLIMAGVFLMTLPLLVLFAFAGRQLVAGIMAGAVKG